MKMPTVVLSTIIVWVSLLFLSQVLWADGGIIILDNFENDTVGSPPGWPDAGNVYEAGDGNYDVVVDLDGQCLDSTDNETDDSFVSQYTSSAEPTIFEARYLFKILSYSGSGAVAYQFLTGSTTDSNESYVLDWNVAGNITFCQHTESFNWSSNTSYQVRFRVDCEADTASLWIDGVEIVRDRSLYVACEDFFDFAFGSYFPETLHQRIDNIKVIDVKAPLFKDGFDAGDLAGWSGH